MKTKSFILIALAAISVSGCFIRALHPFYKEKKVHPTNAYFFKIIHVEDSVFGKH